MAKGRLQTVKLSASGVISTANKAAILWGYNLSGGTTASSISFVNGGASGTELWKGSIKAQTAAGDDNRTEHFTQGILFSADLYGTLAGTGAVCYVTYEEIQN